jgi:hypothetical protein
MSDSHLAGIIKEEVELVTKIDALSSFILNNEIFQTLDQEEKTRMEMQLDAMRLYDHFLVARIEATEKFRQQVREQLL